MVEVRWQLRCGEPATAPRDGSRLACISKLKVKKLCTKVHAGVTGAMSQAGRGLLTSKIGRTGRL